MTRNIIEKYSFRGGDILLCYSPEMRDMGPGIENGYSHAAICIDNSCILESSAKGVAITNIDTLLEEYAHIAVLRSDEIWSERRLGVLRQFSSESVGKEFNGIGMRKYEARKQNLQDTAMERVQGYFEGSVSPPHSERGVYFCSELITSAFIRAGIIEESAAILLSPETFSPEDIGKDKAFGFFIGYIIPYEKYQIPKGDIFENSV